MKFSHFLAVVTFGTLGVLGLFFRLYVGSEPVMEAPAKPRTRAPAPTSWAVEVRQTFAPQMPSGAGTALVASNGEYRATHVLVAVPDATHKIQYLPGTDPRAFKYLQQTHAAQQEIPVDTGPSKEELASVPRQNATFAQGKRVGVNVNKK